MTKQFSFFKKENRGLIIVGIGAAFYFYECILRVAPSVNSNEIINHFGLHAGNFSNLFAIYYYAYMPMQLLVGILVDRYGIHKLLTLASFFCTIGSYLFICSDLLWVAQIGRLLVGFGSSFAFVSVLKLASLWIEKEKISTVSGSIMSIGMIGASLGDMTVSTISKNFGWQYGQYFLIFIGVIITLAIHFKVKEKSELQIREICFGQIFENFKELVKNKLIWINGLIGCLMWLPLAIFAEAWGVKYLQDVHGFSNMLATDAVSTIFWGWAIGGPVFGLLSDRVKNRTLILSVCSLITAGIFLVITQITHPSFFFTCCALFLFGFFNSTQVLVFSLCKIISSNKYAGSTLSFTNMLVMTSGLIQPLTGLIIYYLIKNNHHIYSGYTNEVFLKAFLIIPISLLIAAVFSLYLKVSMSAKVQSP
jgi:MFS family permease